MLCAIWYHLYSLKKREKHRWRNVTFSKLSGCGKRKTMGEGQPYPTDFCFQGGKEKVHWEQMN